MYLLLMVRSRDFWFGEDQTQRPTSNAPADAVVDFRTRHNLLSVFLIDQDRSRERSVCLALAATRSLRPFDYILFDADVVDALQMVRQDTPGEVPAEEASKWHQDILVGTATNLARLVVAIWNYDSLIRERVEKIDVRDGLLQRIREGDIDPKNAKFDGSLRKELDLPRG